MQTIHTLPQHLINKLKAGEIVERPASVVKELVENSLDAGAQEITIDVAGGGAKHIIVEDDGSGIDKDDLRQTTARYATSKISHEDDLETIASYGFRGEALASISEVSLFRIQSKHADGSVGYELYRTGDQFELKEIPYADEHGTKVFVEDLFHNVPARSKFLKTAATENGYIKTVFLHYALAHPDKGWKLVVDGKVRYQTAPADSLLERIQDLYKDERHGHMKPVSHSDEQLEVYGVVSDAALHFSNTQQISLFVNGRPVNDRLIKKAVLDAYYKQLVPRTYPFVVLFVEITPEKVDVNVHPRKSEVKFLDPGSMFTIIKETVQSAIGSQKVNYAAFNQNPLQQQRFRRSSQKFTPKQQQQDRFAFQSSLDNVSTRSDDQIAQTRLDNEQVTIVGQLRDSYIVLESERAIYYVDQHALAERITFEKMRKQVAKEGVQPEKLLQPMTVKHPKHIEVEEVVEQLQQVGFDIEPFGAQKLIIHALPRVFVTYKIDIELILQQAWGMEEISFDRILDEILGMKACKASIKAGQKLSTLEMKQLIDDGVAHVDGMFVCQHGRPSVVKVDKQQIDHLFDR